jgi:hypothetical protein
MTSTLDLAVCPVRTPVNTLSCMVSLTTGFVLIEITPGFVSSITTPPLTRRLTRPRCTRPVSHQQVRSHATRTVLYSHSLVLSNSASSANVEATLALSSRFHQAISLDCHRRPLLLPHSPLVGALPSLVEIGDISCERRGLMLGSAAERVKTGGATRQAMGTRALVLTNSYCATQCCQFAASRSVLGFPARCRRHPPTLLLYAALVSLLLPHLPTPPFRKKDARRHLDSARIDKRKDGTERSR